MCFLLAIKILITRDFIPSIHKLMPIILRNLGFNIDEYEETEEKKQGGLSAKEYKKKMEQEKAYEVMCQQTRNR